MSAETLDRVRGALDGLPWTEGRSRDTTLSVVTEADHVHGVLERLRDRAGFDTNTFVTAIDHLPAEPRYEVSWQLLSIGHNDRVRVSVRVDEDAASVPTCTDLWPGASFAERECFDMFGIDFEGHPDLRRLLMPEGYDHHPLRKDFPHEGIEPDKLYREWDGHRRWLEARDKEAAEARDQS